jgi:phenylcoumaran benzylic ether reductase
MEYLQGSLHDHESLIAALKQVDVVICTVASNCILEQLKLVEAIREVGTIKVRLFYYFIFYFQQEAM